MERGQLTLTESESPRPSERSPSDHEIEVLLVDDDEVWVSSTAEILEHQRDALDVQTATDLETASELYAATDFDCVVCDYDLGLETGLEFLSTVREQAADLPFILITGQGNESVASEAISRDVTDYIPKRSLGGSNERLVRRIESAVESYRAQEALARERRSKNAMLDILRASSSREGLARKFCDHLVSERGYDCAWIGTLSGSDGIVPSAVAGTEEYVDEVIEPGMTPASSDEPALVALDSGEPHVTSVANVDTDDWQSVAAGHGFERAAGIPITHDGTVFGMLAVYATNTNFAPVERSLLVEYGETIGYALRSAEYRESLLSTSPVALELGFTDESVPLVALDQHLPLDSELAVLTSFLREETTLYMLEATGTDADTLREAAVAVESVESVEVTDSGDPVQCELVSTLPTPETTLANRGGQVLEATVENGAASIRAVVPRDDDLTQLVGAIQARYPDADIRSLRTTDQRRQLTGDDLFDALTDKQQRALEVAFYARYFERPREHNTTEVAEKLDICRQTLTQHLRAGQRKLLETMLEARNGTR
jgi:predicted DNA binding protein/DNA-binding NarL/FixJ family response regulator